MRRVIPFMISFVIMLSLSACAAEKDAGTGAEQDQVSNGQQETETLLTMDITDEPALGQEETEEMEIGVFDFEKRSVLLNSGYEMPIMGLGTYSLDYDTCVSSVKALLVSGGRLIDTAYMYHNEEAVGEGIRQAMDEYDIPREEIFVITKIYPNQFSDPEAAIEVALEKLDVGYIDMMLLHHPGTGDVAAYQAMEKSCSKPSDLTACRGYLLEA